MSSRTWSQDQILERCVRYADLRPCTSAFIDTRTPGSLEKENFTIIGPGVAENPEQHVHIESPHGFNVGGARQPPGCVNSQHSHETAEVFIVHSGRWAFTLGPDADDGSIELGPGDTISIPIHVFRGFTNIGEDTGFLFAVLGGDDPGHVTWAPYVFDAAKDYGLILLDDGRLIDTTRGETPPAGSRPMPVTTAADVKRLRRMTADELTNCVVREHELAALELQPFGDRVGLAEAPIIGPDSQAEAMPAGRMSWPHGFHLRRLKIAPEAATPSYARSEAEVILMHAGRLELGWGEGTVDLGPGDVLTVPIGMSHHFRNRGDTPAIAYVVRGGDRPAGYLRAAKAAEEAAAAARSASTTRI